MQIRGHRIRLPLDIVLVATANPEDYTNRGRIITPLKDRFGAQIRTHYPYETMHRGRGSWSARPTCPTAGVPVIVPPFMKEVVAELSQLARRSPHLNQRSGVSVRLSIANYETLVANAVRRALRTGEPVAVPRISDLASLVPSTQGKIEVEAMEEGHEDEVVAQLVAAATLSVFRRRVTLDDPAGDRGRLRRPGRGARRRRPAVGGLPRRAGRHARARAADPQAGRPRGGRCRVAGPHGQRPGVPPRGPAPDQAAQQGRVGRPGPLPRAQVDAPGERPLRLLGWDGTQEFADLDPDDLLAGLTDDLLAGGDLDDALRRLLRSGLPHRRRRAGARAAGPARPAAPPPGRAAGRGRPRRAHGRARPRSSTRSSRTSAPPSTSSSRRRTARATSAAARSPTTWPPSGAWRSTCCPTTSPGGSARLQHYDFVSSEAREHFEELVEELRERDGRHLLRGRLRRAVQHGPRADGSACATPSTP